MRHIEAVFNRKSYAIFRRVLGYIRQSICRSTPLFICSYVHLSLLFVTLDALMNVKTTLIFCISMKKIVFGEISKIKWNVCFSVLIFSLLSKVLILKNAFQTDRLADGRTEPHIRQVHMTFFASPIKCYSSTSVTKKIFSLPKHVFWDTQ